MYSLPLLARFDRAHGKVHVKVNRAKGGPYGGPGKVPST